MCALVRRGMRETTNFTQMSSRVSLEQIMNSEISMSYRLPHVLVRNVTTHTHVQTQVEWTVQSISLAFEHCVLRV